MDITNGELLLEDRPIERLINENFVFPDLNRNNELAVWSLLLMTGYLKTTSYQETDQGPLCQLAIPNRMAIAFKFCSIVKQI